MVAAAPVLHMGNDSERGVITSDAIKLVSLASRRVLVATHLLDKADNFIETGKLGKIRR